MNNDRARFVPPFCFSFDQWWIFFILIFAVRLKNVIEYFIVLYIIIISREEFVNNWVSNDVIINWIDDFDEEKEAIDADK